MPSEFDVINSFAMPSSPLSYATARLCVKRMDEEDAIYLQNSFSPRNCLQSTKLRWPESKFCSLVQPCRMELERPSSQRDLVAFNLALFLLHYHVVKDGFTLVALPWIIPGALHSRQTFDCWTWWQNCTRGSFACSGIVDGIYTQQGSQAVNENCLIRAKLNQVLYDFSFEGVSSADIPRTGAATRFVGFFLRAQVVGVIGWSGQQIRMLAAVGLRNIASIQLLTGRFKNRNLTRITLQTQIETWKIPWSWSWRICKAGEKGDLIVTLICEESWIFFKTQYWHIKDRFQGQGGVQVWQSLRSGEIPFLKFFDEAVSNILGSNVLLKSDAGRTPFDAYLKQVLNALLDGPTLDFLVGCRCAHKLFTNRALHLLRNCIAEFETEILLHSRFWLTWVILSTWFAPSVSVPMVQSNGKQSAGLEIWIMKSSIDSVDSSDWGFSGNVCPFQKQAHRNLSYFGDDSAWWQCDRGEVKFEINSSSPQLV